MGIELTAAAAARMRDFLGQHPEAPGIRFGVTRKGCSGFGYAVDLAQAVTAADRLFDLDGIKVFVRAEDLPLLDGTRIDYARAGLNAAFVFENPNATAACGCGESFTIGASA
ncbi:MAG: iron-sulfur cluster assembly accessory protein [Rhodanobacteraceae bacterium]|nr:MAG: iron-sulfur cluster assembly accessory protein [Rhodanobacteraceae bacterium]